MISDLQTQAWKRLTNLLDRLPHALLIHGAPGVGKLALAERFAQLLVCEARGQGTQPCGRCEGCRWFAAGSHPDVRTVEPEAVALELGRPTFEDAGEESGGREKRKPSTEIRIEQARALGGFVNMSSHRGGRRVCILHPAESMNTATANSLLKILEEPPAGAVFLLVSHRPARLLPTIRSRCVPVPVSVPDRKAAAAWLEKQGLKNAERWLAFAGGAPRRALEYATGERGEAIERVLKALAAEDRLALADVASREDLEPLAEVLQKVALDRAFALLTGRGKYGGGGGGSGDARAWLAYARALGPQRALVRHPLNPRLFATEIVAGMPER
jgi:DNA polymerase-3 subunit delta'